MKTPTTTRTEKILFGGEMNCIKRLSSYRLHEDSEDALQEAALHLVKHEDDPRPDSALAMWAVRTGEHKTIRAKSIDLRYIPGELNAPINGTTYEQGDFIPDTSPTPEQEVERIELIGTIKEATALLTPTQQQIVTLLMQGYSKVEIAESLHMSKQLVGFHISKNIARVFAEKGLK